MHKRLHDEQLPFRSPFKRMTHVCIWSVNSFHHPPLSFSLLKTFQSSSSLCSRSDILVIPPPAHLWVSLILFVLPITSYLTPSPTTVALAFLRHVATLPASTATAATAVYALLSFSFRLLLAHSNQLKLFEKSSTV